MDLKKRKRLEAAGWTVGDAAAFLKSSVSLELLVHALLSAGASRKGVAHALARRVA